MLKNVDFEITKGKTYGLIGPSGSGKSTLLDLIMNIQYPEDGSIVINSKFNINDVSRSWQKILGYVPQNVILTDDTLANNIAFGKYENEIDLDRIKASIKSSQLENYVNKLERGLDTMVGENGIRISGGERQRVGIARALYLNPQILVLDEITSSLDLKTENNLIEDLNNLKGQKTILIITHRLSTLKYCDEIFKIENKQLLKLKMKIYRDLYSFLFLILSVILIFYVFFRSEIYWNGNNREYYKIYYYLSTLFLLFSLSFFLIKKKIKIYLIICLVSFMVALYCFEYFLINKDQLILSKKKKYTLKKQVRSLKKK